MAKKNLESDTTPIEQLKNLGEKSSQALEKINIFNHGDLERLGSINAFLKLEALDDFKPSLNFLYAMEAALKNIHWREINQQQKSQLLSKLDETRLHKKQFEKPDSQVIITQTINWLNDFIIPHNICPFAEHVVIEHRIDYQVINYSNIEDCLIELVEQLIKLQRTENIETALLIFPEAVTDFDDYLEFLAIANQLLEDQDLIDTFQLASFHPDYCFEGEAKDDAANYTNRSPWPMLHLIRQSSIEKGLQFYKNPEQIPVDNIKLTRELGSDYLKKLRNHCMRKI